MWLHSSQYLSDYCFIDQIQSDSILNKSDNWYCFLRKTEALIPKFNSDSDTAFYFVSIMERIILSLMHEILCCVIEKKLLWGPIKLDSIIFPIKYQWFIKRSIDICNVNYFFECYNNEIKFSISFILTKFKN